MAMYSYISFIEPVAIGELGAVNAWSHDKHGSSVEVLEVNGAGGGFLFRGRDKAVRRVPMTNIAYVQYSKETSARIWDQAAKPQERK